MPSIAVESFCASALRYERGLFGSASFAARPRRARRRSRSASRRCEGSARSAGNRAAGTPCRTLRSARLQRSATRNSESSAALQTRLRGRRLQNAAQAFRITPFPTGRGRDKRPLS